MIQGVITEIDRLEYTLASISIDQGRGINPQNLDVPCMERSLVLLRAYRDICQPRSNFVGAMARVSSTEFGNLAVTDPIVAALRKVLVS